MRLFYGLINSCRVLLITIGLLSSLHTLFMWALMFIDLKNAFHVQGVRYENPAFLGQQNYYYLFLRHRAT